MKVYLDNAATTALDPEVFEAMKPLMLEMFGNPSSTHAHGREVRTRIEQARRTVAELLNTVPGEIFFTSGGTEADNTAIRCTVDAYGVQHIISSPIEHHAVLHTVEMLAQKGKVKLSMVEHDEKGHINMGHLEQLLKAHPNSMVSLMHANNEIGTLNDIEKIGNLSKEYDAIFHSDTVQTMGHFKHDLQALNCDFIVGAAHKFHGPKGVGFLRVARSKKIGRFIEGGGQERNKRGGTENVYGIVGMAKALELAYANMDRHRKQIQALKERMIEKLKNAFPDIRFNGDLNPENSLYTVLNVSFPPHENNPMLLFSLDINGISASGGSACSSGANTGSHVLNGIEADPERLGVRFSFSKFNTASEVDYTVQKLQEILTPVAV